jgi:ADP-dependent phosphofructokinase/glucokinase
MAKRMEDSVLNLYDCLLEATKREIGRKEVLRRADYELERLKHYLRLCTDLQFFSLKQYEYATQHTVEIGRLLGGWLKKT